jgi:hypothetical protein
MMVKRPVSKLACSNGVVRSRIELLDMRSMQLTTPRVLDSSPLGPRRPPACGGAAGAVLPRKPVPVPSFAGHHTPVHNSSCMPPQPTHTPPAAPAGFPPFRPLACWPPDNTRRRPAAGLAAASYDAGAVDEDVLDLEQLVMEEAADTQGLELGCEVPLFGVFGVPAAPGGYGGAALAGGWMCACVVQEGDGMGRLVRGCGQPPTPPLERLHPMLPARGTPHTPFDHRRADRPRHMHTQATATQHTCQGSTLPCSLGMVTWQSAATAALLSCKLWGSMVPSSCLHQHLVAMAALTAWCVLGERRA